MAVPPARSSNPGQCAWFAPVPSARTTSSALMTLGIGLLGARADQRQLLIGASSLMVATGFAFALSSTYAVILLVAFMGTINPSSGSVSIFVPLEHAVLARSVANANRTRMFARYSLIGALSAAVGALASGSPDLLATLGVRLGLGTDGTRSDGFRMMDAAEAERRAVMRRVMSAAVPWLRLMRATFMPASSRASMSGSEAGPMVATILVLRMRKSSGSSQR